MGVPCQRHTRHTHLRNVEISPFLSTPKFGLRHTLGLRGHFFRVLGSLIPITSAAIRIGSSLIFASSSKEVRKSCSF